MGFNKYIMACTHHYRIQSIFGVLKNPCALPIHPPKCFLKFTTEHSFCPQDSGNTISDSPTTPYFYMTLCFCTYYSLCLKYPSTTFLFMNSLLIFKTHPFRHHFFWLTPSTTSARWLVLPPQHPFILQDFPQPGPISHYIMIVCFCVYLDCESPWDQWDKTRICSNLKGLKWVSCIVPQLKNDYTNTELPKYVHGTLVL